MKALIVLMAMLAWPVLADEESDFQNWKHGLIEQAVFRGISERTATQAMAEVELIPRVINLDAKQPEFTQTFLQYLSLRVSDKTVEQGRLMYEQQQPLLDSLQQRYGVDTSVLLALWGLETAYGRTMGNLDLLSALATLSYQGRRKGFFTEQLLVLLSLIDSGRYDTDSLQGSWAGAFGHMQFIPTTLQAYGVDADNNGIIDLRGSLADAMASAANYLNNVGWKTNEPIALEVFLPTGFDYADAQLGNHKSIEEWASLGVMPAATDSFPQVTGKTSILLPQGFTGPAFMVFDNFDVIMDWNRSVNYALAVAQLANQFEGLPALVTQETQQSPISISNTSQLQHFLLQAGFDPGEPDGIAGPQTQSAIREYQIKHGLIADGYPSQSLLEHVLENLGRELQE